MVYANLQEESILWEKGFNLVCGVDEVGRGCFAGPVVVGAVIFPKYINLKFKLADSKLLSAKKRQELDLEIKETALFWGITEISVEVINQIGIGKATQKAFFDVIKNLSKAPDFILIDAFYIEELDKSIQKPIVGGDKISASIAAASIIAKVYRDNLMQNLNSKYDIYNFSKHKGYGTLEHRKLIKTHGLSDMHRTSFDLKKYV